MSSVIQSPVPQSIITSSLVIKSCLVILGILLFLQLNENRVELILEENENATATSSNIGMLHEIKHEKQRQKDADQYYFDDSSHISVGLESEAPPSSNGRNTEMHSSSTHTLNATNESRVHHHHRSRRRHSLFRRFLPGEAVDAWQADVGRNWPDQAAPPRELPGDFSPDDLDYMRRSNVEQERHLTLLKEKFKINYRADVVKKLLLFKVKHPDDANFPVSERDFDIAMKHGLTAEELHRQSMKKESKLQKGKQQKHVETQNRLKVDLHHHHNHNDGKNNIMTSLTTTIAKVKTSEKVFRKNSAFARMEERRQALEHADKKKLS